MRWNRQYIEDVAVAETGYTLEQMRIRTRKQSIADARVTLAKYLRANTRMSQREVAELVGWGNDRTMVSWAERKK